MERLNFERNGVIIRLPPGFRFLPTDEELVLQYLKPKVFAQPLPSSIIPEVYIWKQDPWVLPGDLKRERYFFSSRIEIKSSNGNEPDRETPSGFWKAIGTDKKIIDSRSNEVAGMMKTLVFCRRKPSNEIVTYWVMHEYRLVGSETTQANSLVKLKDRVLCRVFPRKKNNN